MDKEKLIQRQQEILRRLGGKAKKRGNKSKEKGESRSELNRELREINEKLKGYPDYQKKPLQVKSKGKRKKGGPGTQTKQNKHEPYGKPLPPPGEWIHVWRG